MTEPHASTKVYLKPGQLAVTGTPTVVSTVLGSCVSMVFFSPSHSIGAITHAMLPYGTQSGDFKYVNQSFRYIIDMFDHFRVPRNSILVKLFGGANILDCLAENSKQLTIGTQNTRAAISLLDQAGMSPVSTDVGGTDSRKLVFYSQTGEVFLKRFANSAYSVPPAQSPSYFQPTFAR